MDCDDDNYACAGGWMYEGFEYVNRHGLLLKRDYMPYSRRRESCRVSAQDLARRKHIKDIGYVEHDGRTNEELRVLLQ